MIAMIARRGKSYRHFSVLPSEREGQYVTALRRAGWRLAVLPVSHGVATEAAEELRGLLDGQDRKPGAAVRLLVDAQVQVGIAINKTAGSSGVYSGYLASIRDGLGRGDDLRKVSLAEARRRVAAAERALRHVDLPRS
jgi:hypothetical protein